MLGTKTGSPVSLHWASSTHFSQHHTIPSLLQTLGGKAPSAFGPPGTCSALGEPWLFLSLWWAALDCPSKGQIFGAPQPIFLFVAPIILDREEYLSSASKQCLLKDYPGYRKAKGALCSPAYKDTRTRVLLEYTLYFQSPETIVFRGSPTTKPHESHADQPPNNTLGSRPDVDYKGGLHFQFCSQYILLWNSNFLKAFPSPLQHLSKSPLCHRATDFGADENF